MEERNKDTARHGSRKKSFSIGPKSPSSGNLDSNSILRMIRKRQGGQSPKDVIEDIREEEMLTVNETCEILRDIDNVLSEAIGVKYLRAYMKNKLNDELLLFLIDLDKYTYDPSKKKKMKILATYIEVGSSLEVNINDEVRTRVLERAESTKGTDITLFDEAKSEVTSLLSDIFDEFLISREGRNLAYLWKSNKLFGMSASMIRNADPPPRLPVHWRRDYGQFHQENIFHYMRSNIVKCSHKNEDSLMFSISLGNSSLDLSRVETGEIASGGRQRAYSSGGTTVVSVASTGMLQSPTGSTTEEAGKAGGIPILDSRIRIIPNYTIQSRLTYGETLAADGRFVPLTKLIENIGLSALLDILSPLSPRELLNLALVSKKMFNIAFKSDRVWEALILAHFREPVYKILRFNTVSSFSSSFQLYKYLWRFSPRISRCLASKSEALLLSRRGDLFGITNVGSGDANYDVKEFDNFGRHNPCAVVCAGENISLAVNAEGYIFRWSSIVPTPTKIEFFVENKETVKVVSVAVGTSHFLAVTEDGQVYGWGSSKLGQLGLGGSVEYVERPAKIEGFDEAIFSCAAGSHHSVLVTVSGRIFTMGTNDLGVLGMEGSVAQKTPTRVDTLDETAAIVYVSSSESHNAAISINGEIYTWGYGKNGQLGYKVDKWHDIQRVPKLVECLNDHGKICNISTTNTATLGTFIDGNAFILGSIHATDDFYPDPLILNIGLYIKHISLLPFLEPYIMMVDNDGAAYISKKLTKDRAKRLTRKSFGRILKNITIQG